MTYKKILLNEVPKFDLYVSRSGNNETEALNNLKFALNRNTISVPKEAVIYVYPTCQGMYEAAFGPEQKKRNNLPTQILHGDDLRRYLEKLPGKNAFEKLRALGVSPHKYRRMSEKGARNVLEGILKSCDSDQKDTEDWLKEGEKDYDFQI